MSDPAARVKPAAGPGSADGFERLSADVDFLGTCLGEVLREQEGQRLFELVERVRGLTKAIRSGGEDARASQRRELADVLQGLDTGTAEKLVRAFTVYF
ncbi:MAG TPA: phosphoenolpyruvate carboxylase, partial [Trueperaceae bacterium]|nr:phosphoenolpyruvate carboxylase [Trueperaceae bacterium]